MKRFVKQIFALSGKIVTKNGEIKKLILNPFYPRMTKAEQPLHFLFSIKGEASHAEYNKETAQN